MFRCVVKFQSVHLNGLEGRLQRATTKLLALTPPPARGKRQIQEEAELVNAAIAILKAHDVEGFLTYTFERQEKRETKYIGRGRGNPNRPTREIVSVRYPMLIVIRQEATIATHQKTLGWRAYVSAAILNMKNGPMQSKRGMQTYRAQCKELKLIRMIKSLEQALC